MRKLVMFNRVSADGFFGTRDGSYEPGKTITIFGSGSIVRQLTQHELIDEYTFVVGPVLLGTGKRLLDDVKTVKLELLESKAYPSGKVVLRYARKS